MVCVFLVLTWTVTVILSLLPLCPMIERTGVFIMLCRSIIVAIGDTTGSGRCQLHYYMSDPREILDT